MGFQFSDNRNIHLICFSNFIVKARNLEPSQVKIRFDLKVFTECINAEFKIHSEISEIEILLRNLEGMNRDLKGAFWFEDIDQRLKIRFSQNDFGRILIECNVCEKDFMSRLETNFETDQSYLNDVIVGCRELIRKLRA
jgi:hypothetical protein